MAINLDQVKTELGNYFRVNNKEVVSMVYNDDVQLNRFCRQITRVKGEFPATHSITSHVIQGFKDVWNEMGDTTFKTNKLNAWHQKVNFPVRPFQIEGSWLAEMNEEDKNLENKSISKYIVENELKPKVTEDLEYLSGDGVRDENDLETFGKSMDGIKKVLTDGIADTDNPMFKIQLSALNDDNIVDQVTKFERGIPKKVRRTVKYIFMATSLAEAYALDYENTYGANTLIKEGDFFKTRLGKRVIVGLDCLEGWSGMFCTPERNMLQLIDKFDKPTVTDIQKEDYKLKVFMEFRLGYGFWINQLVIVSTTTAGSGLGAQNALYYA